MVFSPKKNFCYCTVRAIKQTILKPMFRANLAAKKLSFLSPKKTEKQIKHEQKRGKTQN